MEAEGVINGMLRNSQANGFWFDDASGESRRDAEESPLNGIFQANRQRDTLFIAYPSFLCAKNVDF
jgi:hypothetical protein